MGVKIKEQRTFVYKPEILICPFCGGKLSYRHTVSNKVIQFTNGKYTRVKNLGYGCDNCDHNKDIYFSQTASKMCIKGYTYSSKVIAIIAYYKLMHYSREKICDILWLSGIEISDRNIDLIYNKYIKNLDMDYKSNIVRCYKNMIEKYKSIRLSIDLISYEGVWFVSIRDFFSGEQMGLHIFNKGREDENLYKVLGDYLNKELPISHIVTIRPIFSFYHILKSFVTDKTEFLSYIKY